MFNKITRKVYNLFFTILLPLLFLKLLIKSIKLRAYRDRWLERLGIFNLPTSGNNNIWIHAVSVGEVIAAIPIIQKIKEQLPNISIVLTCTTPAGSAIIKQKLSNSVLHLYFPFDVNFAINNFLRKIQPKLLIIIEKEIWPNLILNCNQHKIPIIIANAQVSNKSFYRYLLIKSLISYCLQTITYICAQTKFDGYKLQQIIGSNLANNITITGNSKFDLAWQNSLNTDFNLSQLTSPLKNINRPIWIAASTHPIEEQFILAAHKIILQQIPNALLILVPRHPERSQEIANNLYHENFSYTIHSDKSMLLTEQIYLVDSIGELNMFYKLSQAAFVGGSLVPIGGHNVLEPASFAIPIAIGPYTANCEQIVFRMKLANGLVKVKNTENLSCIIIKWLKNTNLRTIIGQNAKNYLYHQTGASEKIIKLVTDLL